MCLRNRQPLWHVCPPHEHDTCLARVSHRGWHNCAHGPDQPMQWYGACAHVAHPSTVQPPHGQCGGTQAVGRCTTPLCLPPKGVKPLGKCTTVVAPWCWLRPMCVGAHPRAAHARGPNAQRPPALCPAGVANPHPPVTVLHTPNTKGSNGGAVCTPIHPREHACVVAPPRAHPRAQRGPRIGAQTARHGHATRGLRPN